MKLRSSSSSSDLLQQVGVKEAKLPSRADLQVTVDLLSLLHHDLRTREINTYLHREGLSIISCSKSTTNPQRGHRNFEQKLIRSPTVAVCSETFMNAEQVPIAGGDRDVHVKHVWSLWEELCRPTSRANYTISPVQTQRQKHLTGSECRNRPDQDLSVSKLTFLSVLQCVKATMCRVGSPGLSSG